MKQNLSTKDTLCLDSILESIYKISKYTDGFQNQDEFFENEKAFDASLMNFVVIGEMVLKLKEEYKNANNKIDWNRIKDFRNLVAHDYFGIDAEEVWQIIKKDLSKLEKEVLGIIKA